MIIADNIFEILITEDFARQLLRRVYRAYPFEKIRQLVSHFRIIPTISLNPVNNEVDVSFGPSPTPIPVLEDVLNLIEKLSSEKKRAIVVFDEFQEVQQLGEKEVSLLSLWHVAPPG